MYVHMYVCVCIYIYIHTLPIIQIIMIIRTDSNYTNNHTTNT